MNRSKARGWREDLLEMCERRFLADPAAEPGRMMGHPGFKCAINNKFFLFCHGDGIAMKLPPGAYDAALAREDVIPFAPMGERKPMSTWVVWTQPDPAGYEAEWELVEAAFGYTASEPPNPKKRRKR